jgi:hypothetical protein
MPFQCTYRRRRRRVPAEIAQQQQRWRKRQATEKAEEEAMNHKVKTMLAEQRPWIKRMNASRIASKACAAALRNGNGLTSDRINHLVAMIETYDAISNAVLQEWANSSSSS